MKSFTKFLLAAGTLAFSALSQAAPVTTWDVDVNGQWTGYAPAGVSQPNPQTLRWGTTSGLQSSLVITNPATTSIDTYYGGGTPPSSYVAPSVSLRHNNFVINAPFLTDATLRLDVNLTPTAPPGPAYAVAPVSYNIGFRETTNSPPCTVASPTPCNDIFVLVGGFLNTSFVYDAQTYFINAFPIAGGSLSLLSAAACADAGEAAGCLGFTTPENASTDLAFGLTISSARLAVPEPGSVALVGLALACLAWVSRRRSAV